MKKIITTTVIAACLALSPISFAGIGFDFVHLEEHMLGVDQTPCAESYFVKNDVDQKVLKKREYEFEKAVCLVNKNRSTPGGISALADYEDAVELFYRSSQKGLDAAKQNYANLLEGLAHCQLAKAKSAGIGEEFAKKIEFCTEWRMGRNALNQVNWRTLNLKMLVEEAGDSNGRWEDVDIAPLLEEYQIC